MSSTAAAIEALEDGRVHAAAVHWPGAQSHPTARSVRRYVIARWRVGIATRAGTKLEIDLLASGKIRVAGRELGAEVQRALERLLTSLGQVPHLTGPVATGHLDAARHVAYGSADAAPTMEAAALAYGLEFSPLESHRVELWIDAEWADHPGAGALLEALTSRALLDRLEALGGYDLSQTGGAA